MIIDCDFASTRGRLLPCVGSEGVPSSAGCSPTTAEPVEPNLRRQPSRLWRTAIHEASHCVVASYLGLPDVSATIVPGDGFAGLAWSGDDPAFAATYSTSTSAAERDDRSAKIKAALPPPGSARDCLHPLLANLHDEVLFAMAGPVGEGLFFEEVCQKGCRGDFAQARSLASQICTSPASVEAFVSWGQVEAKAILGEHRGAVLTLASALLKHRTITGKAHINGLIDMGERREGLHKERQRRRRVRKAMLRAAESKHLFEPLSR